MVESAGGPGELTYADGAGGATSVLDTFTTTQGAGIPDIGGVDTPVLFFDYHNPNTLGYQIRPLTGAVGDAIWRYSLVFDVFIDASNTTAGSRSGKGTRTMRTMRSCSCARRSRRSIKPAPGRSRRAAGTAASGSGSST